MREKNEQTFLLRILIFLQNCRYLAVAHEHHFTHVHLHVHTREAPDRPEFMFNSFVTTELNLNSILNRRNTICSRRAIILIKKISQQQ